MLVGMALLEVTPSPNSPLLAFPQLLGIESSHKYREWSLPASRTCARDKKLHADNVVNTRIEEILIRAIMLGFSFEVQSKNNRSKSTLKYGILRI